jgi:inorganic triphosphatase YgiF
MIKQSEDALYELKFTLPHHRAEVLLSFLSNTLKADAKHPAGIISTIYYDTQDLQSLRQKVTSDYLKPK